MTKQPMPLWKNFLFHLIPGFIITAVYLLLSNIITSSIIPKALFISISTLTLIPIAYIIMKKNSSKRKVINVIENREKIALWKMIFLGFISFIWAALAMTVLKEINLFFENTFFNWMSANFTFSDYLTNPEQYPKYMLIITWVVGVLTTSTLTPLIEEFYFRGFLLKKLERYKMWAVFLSALFFSLYHVFSPWMFLTRFIALLPMTYFVWKYKDIRIAILAHILLNLLGDSVSAIPIIFGS